MVAASQKCVFFFVLHCSKLNVLWVLVCYSDKKRKMWLKVAVQAFQYINILNVQIYKCAGERKGIRNRCCRKGK